jgi:HSP20 family protein
MKPNIDDETKKPVSLQDTREPLIDIIDEPERIKVIAELPGVDKEDINLTATERSLIIDVNNPIRKYHKELEFPVDVDEVSATSSYKNGVLETVIQKKREKGKGRTVTIY